MPDPNVTSAEQLDDLLREGKISQEEYETLRKAMDTAAAEEAEHRRHEARPRLGRSWKNRQLGGVCAGIAERFGMEPWCIRLIFCMAFLFTSFLALSMYGHVLPTGLMILFTVGPTPLAYLVLCIILPWNDKTISTAHQEWKGFAVRVAVLWPANLAAYGYLAPHCARIFEDFGGTLPPLTQLILALSKVFLARPVIGFVGAFVALGCLFGLYLILPPDKPVRRVYAVTVYVALLLMFILAVAALCLPLIMLADTAR
jgi:phage shock protein PspC (stress-responsive transcriptional regulator)